MMGSCCITEPPAFRRSKRIRRPIRNDEMDEKTAPSISPGIKRLKSEEEKPGISGDIRLHSMDAVPRLMFSPLEGAKILKSEFFRVDSLELAPRLLGKLLRRDDVVLRITEVEAYRENDTACHGRFGITPRTAAMFGPGGHAYVYLCYGVHSMLNIVADKEGVGSGVLIRSCAPVSGLETIQKRRNQKTEKPILLTGPGKVGQALGISTEWSKHPLYVPGGLEVLDGPEPDEVLVSPRVGIEYAAPEDVSALWRFAIAGSPWVSAPRNTLRLP